MRRLTAQPPPPTIGTHRAEGMRPFERGRDADAHATTPTYKVTELLGDGIGPELSRAVHALADALPIRLDFRAGRPHPGEPPGPRQGGLRRGGRVDRRRPRSALKYPTVTAEESPNAVLRRRLDLSVIHRPVYTIPGVPTNFRRELDLDIVRIATGGTYDDPGRMIGEDGAVSLRIVERRPVREAARYAFGLARKTGKRVTIGLEVHDPEGDRRPVRGRRQGGRRASTPRSRTTSSCSTPCSARSSWRRRSSRSCWC